MILKLIAFLQWIQSNEKPKKWFDFFFSFIFTASSISLIYTVLSEAIFTKNYGRMNPYLDSFGNESYFRPDIAGNTTILVLIIILLLSLCFVYLYAIYRKITQKNYSIVRIIMNSALPIFIGILFIAYEADQPGELSWYHYIFGGLYVFSPFILLLSKSVKLNKGKGEQFFDYYKHYIVSFLIGISIFFLLYTLVNISGEFEYAKVSQIIIILSSFICISGFIVWFVLTYAWMEIENTLTEKQWKSILRNGVLIAFIFLVIWMSPNWKQVLIENRINTANMILSKNGETQQALNEAESIWFLRWSLKQRYLTRTYYSREKDIYTKVYDAAIEDNIDESVDANTYGTRNSNGTSQIAKEENAKVELNFAKHESEILSDINAIKTVVTYEFQNTDEINQEVIFSIVLPNIESAMTDLRLGLNLEYTGVIAPRGAAEKVYKDSLRRNTDPALLEQTGPLTYRLRVFPVPSTTDTKSQGRQRVQFTYTSPLGEDGLVTTIPKTEILNLKLNKKSEVLTRVMEGDTALIQDSKTGKDMTLLTSGKSEKLTLKAGKSYNMYCSTNSYPNMDPKQYSIIEKNLSKNIVFFDISKSVENSAKIKKRYQTLIDAWKNNGVSLDVFSYNFAVYPSGYALDTIEFWGTTDMSKIIEYINKNAISNANIVIVTDDASFERVQAENKTIDYRKLGSNRISLIQVGGKIRTLKTEITKAILATDGTMMIIDETTPLNDAVKNIFGTKKTIETCENYTGKSLNELKAIQGYNDSRIMYSSYEGEKIAKIAHIVNQSVSLIALESESQQKDLERYSEGNNKYDTTYENFSNENDSRSGLFWGGKQAISSNRTSGGFDGKSVSLGSTSVGSSSPGTFSGGISTNSNNTSVWSYVIILICFPIISWFILRRKPKIKGETQIESESPKNE